MSMLKRVSISIAMFLPLAAAAQNHYPSTGNVGIGTGTSPQANLHVQSLDTPFILIHAKNYTNGPAVIAKRGGIIFSQENGDKTAAIQFAVPPGTHVPGILFSTKTAWNAPGPGMKDWYDRMFIHPNGNVGIGTVAPGSMFNVNQGSYPTFGAADKVLSIHGSGNLPVVELGRDAGSANGVKVGALYFTNTLNQEDAHRQVAGFWAENVQHTSYPTLSGGRLVLMTKAIGGGAQSKLIYDERGNLNIGLAAPNTLNYRLAVEGTIGARKVKVTQETWADFVFRPGYRLPPLQELEEFIGKHQHLPDIPSEREVLKEGVDLGEMNKKLLQKVEELSLYIIDLNKRVKMLEKELGER